MRQNNVWSVTVGEQTHVVRYEEFKTVFDVYVDDELAVRVPRESDGDTEYDIRVGGKKCQFVIYDGTPDLAVDGILLGAEEEQRRAERRGKLLKLIGGVALMAVAAFTAFLWWAVEAAGESTLGGAVPLVGSLVFLLAGVALVLSAVRKKSEY